MGDDIQKYVRSYLVCKLDKTEKKKTAGLLQLFPMPEVIVNPSLRLLIDSQSMQCSYLH